jgi:hypothetical protein
VLQYIVDSPPSPLASPDPVEYELEKYELETEPSPPARRRAVYVDEVVDNSQSATKHPLPPVPDDRNPCPPTPARTNGSSDISGPVVNDNDRPTLKPKPKPKPAAAADGKTSRRFGVRRNYRSDVYAQRN